jgi:hypothetical protein
MHDAHHHLLVPVRGVSLSSPEQGPRRRNLRDFLVMATKLFARRTVMRPAPESQTSDSSATAGSRRHISVERLRHGARAMILPVLHQLHAILSSRQISPSRVAISTAIRSPTTAHQKPKHRQYPSMLPLLIQRVRRM